MKFTVTGASGLSYEVDGCPFCGSTPIIDWYGFGEICALRCQNNDCQIDGPAEESESDAVSAWNTRP